MEKLDWSHFTKYIPKNYISITDKGICISVQIRHKLKSCGFKYFVFAVNENTNQIAIQGKRHKTRFSHSLIPVIRCATINIFQRNINGKYEGKFYEDIGAFIFDIVKE